MLSGSARKKTLKIQVLPIRRAILIAPIVRIKEL
jgi:hypothetical protein